jgi:molecular chaperone DnaK
VPQIEVTFDIDANGIVSVTAKDKATGKEQKITITASSGLAKDEIERMVRDAEQHAEEDRKRRELIEARNAADSLIYAAERSLREAGEAIDGPTRTEVEDKIRALREVLDSEDEQNIRNRTAELSVAVQKVGQAMYSTTGSASSNGADSRSEKADGDTVVDGDYKVD